jgi:DNA-directed RNA polymerase subunit RPC12/RpoP
MKKIYECGICGVVTEANGETCVPKSQGGVQDYCGTTRDNSEMCDFMKEHLTYVCGNCGRPAEQAELVCNPLVTA